MGRLLPPAGSRTSVLTAAVVALLLVAVGLAQTSAGRRLARSVGLAAPAEPFTELYFADQAAIAASTEGYVHGATRQRVGFVIRNSEHHTMTYAWTLTSDGASRGAGTVRVRAGASATVRRSIATGCRFRFSQPAAGGAGKPAASTEGPLRSTGPARVRISVSLSRPRRSIDYWLACHV